MKQIKLKPKLVVLLLLMFVVLTACTGNQTSDDQSDSGTTPQIYDIVWWGLFDKEEVIQPLIDQYNQTNPNVNISYVQITDGIETGDLIANYRTRLDENLTDDEPLDTPDIITIHNTWLGRYSQQMVPAPGNIFSTQTISEQYYPVVTSDFVRGSSVYAVPLYMDSLALIVNKDLMIEQSAVDSDGPEDNWFDFKDQAERLTTYDDNNRVEIAGYAAGAPNVEFITGTLSALMLQSNIDMVNTDQINGFSTEAIFANDSESATILDFYKKFENETNKMTWNSNFESEIASFLDEELVIYTAPSWRLNDILRLNDFYNLDLNIEVHPMPQVDPTDLSNTIYWADYWGIGVTADSQRRGQSNEVWNFIKFMSEDAQLRTLNSNSIAQDDRQLNIIYPKPNMSNELKTDQYLGVYVTSLERAQTWDMVDGYIVDELIRNEFEDEPDANQLQSTINSSVITKRTNLLSTNSAQ